MSEWMKGHWQVAFSVLAKENGINSIGGAAVHIHVRGLFFHCPDRSSVQLK